MKFGQLRQRINAGDEDAAAYLADRFKPLQESFARIAAPFKDFNPPTFEVLDDEAEHRERMAELSRTKEENARRVAAERAAAVERERAMVEGIAAMREIMEASVGREIDADARGRLAGARERRMFWFTAASCATGVIAMVVAIVALV